MIEIKTNKGLTKMALEGSGSDILADLALINARVIHEVNMPDEIIKQLFETTLQVLQLIREADEQ